MAPTILSRSPSGQHIRQVSRSISSTFASLKPRVAEVSEAPLVSMFALVLSRGSSLTSKTASAISHTLQRSPEARAATGPLLLSKRQTGTAILAIPRTYRGLDAGPSPGAVVGIMLGSIAGFILCLYILLFAFQFSSGRGEVVVEEEIITTKRKSSRSRRSSHRTVMSERPTTIRRETTVVEEIRRAPPPPRDDDEEIIVEELASLDDEIVEVIEDPSSVSSRTPPPPNRRESRRSGFRHVDPAEPGGGRDSFKRVNRR